MEPTDMLSSILSDPQKLQSAISMASSLFGGENNADASMPAPTSGAADDLAAVAASTPAPSHFTPPSLPGGGFGTPAFSGFDPSAELMSRAMPVISAIARSGKTAVSREKANLLNSIKPFVATNIGGQLDHAMRLVSMARMARSAMGQIGGAVHGGDSTREL